MKILLATLIFLTSTAVQSQSNPLMYVDLDREVLRMRQSAMEQNAEDVASCLQNVTSMWKEYSALLDIHLAPERAFEVINCQEDRLFVMKRLLDGERFHTLAGVCEVFMTELVSLRDTYENSYPLDHLWKTKLFYDDLRNIVNDPLLELLEWNEIDRLYEKLNCSWQEYEMLFQDLIPFYFPDINQEKQRALFDSMAQCFERLRKALDTGYRPDFILPCDEIGHNIDENLKMYARPDIGAM